MLRKSKKKLGKLCAILLTLVMAMTAMTVTAFATEPADGAETTTDTRSFAKTYTGTATEGVVPAEALTYQVTGKSVTDNTNTAYNTAANIPNITVSKAAADTSFAITLPEYTGIGKFVYNMSENTGSTAGVAYDAAPITVVVLRTWTDGAGSTINTSCYIQNTAGTAKIDSVTNTFNTGSLEVSKVITGNACDPNDSFNITVTFTAAEGTAVRSPFTYSVAGGTATTVAAADWTDGTTYTATIALKGGEKADFSDIPAGVSYAVTEPDSGEYTVSYTNATGTIPADKVAATVTNEKNISVDTGLIMTVAPYVLMVILACGIAFFFLRRKHAE